MRWFFILALGGLGAWLLLSSVQGVIATLALQRRGVPGKGTIVDVTRSGGRRPVWSATVEFTAADGKAYQLQTSVSADTAGQKGTAVDVVYVPDRPSFAVAAGREPSVIDSLPTAILGVLVLGGLMFLLNPLRGMEALSGSIKWLALVIIGGTGLAFFLSGVVWSGKRFLLLRTGVQAEGTVVERLPAARGSGSLPVVEFAGADGQKHRLASGSTGDYAIGARVRVVYARNNASGATINDFGQYWFGPLAMALFGLVFVGMGALAFHFLRDVTFGPMPSFIQRRPGGG